MEHTKELSYAPCAHVSGLLLPESVRSRIPNNLLGILQLSCVAVVSVCFLLAEWEKHIREGGHGEHKKEPKKNNNTGEERGRKRHHLIWLNGEKKRLLHGLVFPNRTIYRIRQRAISCASSVRLLTSCLPTHYKFFLNTYDLHRKFFSYSSVLFVKFFGLIVFSQAAVHYCQVAITCCYNGMIFTKNFFANRQ